MQLNTGEVHIWSGPVNIGTDTADKLSILLNQEEIARATRLIDPNDQLQFIAAHAMLRQILSTYLNIPAAEIQFNYSAYKKPSLAQQHTLQFNLTHSGNHTAIAVTRSGSIGIDIEKLTGNNKMNVAERYFSSEEIAELQLLSEKEQIEAFYHLWACKEAVIKANGKGLSIPLHSFSVSLTNQPYQIALEGNTWTIIPVQLLDDYKCALAVDTPIQSITLCEFNLQNQIIRKTIEL